MKTTDNLLTNLQLYLRSLKDLTVTSSLQEILILTSLKSTKNQFSVTISMQSQASFSPKITLPTRFSNMNGTLIDNFLYKISHRLLKTSAGIILSRISDHLPYFVLLDYVNIKLKNITKFIQVKQQNASNLNNFKAELSRTNLLTNFDLSIDADPNRNYDITLSRVQSINIFLPKPLNLININTKIQTGLHRVLSSQLNIYLSLSVQMAQC